jgi:hypothetical protein
MRLNFEGTNIWKCMRVLDFQLKNFIVSSNKFRLGKSVKNWILYKMFPNQRRPG